MVTSNQHSPALQLDYRLAVRCVELSSLQCISDLSEYRRVRVYLMSHGSPIGYLDLENNYQDVSVSQLSSAIQAQFSEEELAMPSQPLSCLPNEMSVSIVITTYDRPDDLAQCLHHLLCQKTTRRVEVIVVDNHPQSGLTAQVTAQFPTIKLLTEARKGSSYGRNAAIAASTGDIIITIDDDVVVPAHSNWLETLIAPFNRPEVMVVTGNILPLELETVAQYQFETIYQGLSCGFEPFEANSIWLKQHGVWSLSKLGVSANAAFRSQIFQMPEIGLMDEVLGAGTPVGGAEETYLFYKILKAGYTLVYQPGVYVWHKHRRQLHQFHRQIQAYNKSDTALKLHVWQQENDLRPLSNLLVGTPRHHLRRIYQRIQGKLDVTWALLWSEISGHIQGYWGYWQSIQRVKQLGKSCSYIPVSARSLKP